MRTGPRTGLRDLLRELAQRQGGVHSSDARLEPWGTALIGSQARQLVLKGEIFSAKVSRRNVRYFGTAADRDTFITRNSNAWTIAKRAVGRPESAPWGVHTPAVVPAHVVVQVCPGYMPRSQEHTFSFIHGGLRCA